jgi:hypothetical protein
MAFLISFSLFVIIVFQSMITHWAIILRDRARSTTYESTNQASSHRFESIQNNIVILSTIGSGFCALGAICAASFMFYPQILLKGRGRLWGFWCAQTGMACSTIIVGGYLGDGVRGFQSAFTKFTTDNVPYYAIMYYGGVTEAAFGCVYFIMSSSICVYYCLQW